MSSKVLLTISGNQPADLRKQIADGHRPLTDYVAMADHFPADLIDYQRAQEQASWFGRLLHRLGGNNLLLAWVCFQLRGQYDLIFTDGEQIGLPLAFLLKLFGGSKRPAHFMIVHILSTRSKQMLLDYLGLATHIDIFFVYSTWQQTFIRERWGQPEEKVQFTPFMVDHRFFAVDQVDPDEPIDGFVKPDQPLVCAVGLEFRDYPTLLAAVDGLNCHVVIAAGSPWSKRSDSTAGQKIPENVTVRKFSQYELRQIYAMSEFLVMPLYDVNFQAGVTALLEAMSMQLAVVCSRTPGQTDVVIDKKSGIYVPPSDVQALREAMQYLLDHPDQCRAMGDAGRNIIEDDMSLDRYVARFQAEVGKISKD
ncbi:MAG: glycosyltransferase family 4 protein [Ardenticatenaceae bacterium]|nr:glycosyltransferase family 4 protein [Ardenticatenaceae bacterium]